MAIEGKIIATNLDAEKAIGDTVIIDRAMELVEYTIECEDGRMFVVDEGPYLSTQVNFCPLTGKEARTKVEV